MLGTILKESITQSGISQEEVAAAAEMSLTNLYKIFKKDSMESRYLVRICRKLKIPYSQLLGPEDWLDKNDPKGSNVMIASRTGSNNQSYSIGSTGAEEIMRLKHELQLCQVQRDGLEQQLTFHKQQLDFHKEMIEVLKNK